MKNQNWPKTLEEAIEILLRKIPVPNQVLIKSASKDDLIELHMSLGMGIRNEFGLWQGNKELLKECGSEDMHPDDASMLILEKLWERLQNS